MRKQVLGRDERLESDSMGSCSNWGKGTLFNAHMTFRGVHKNSPGLAIVRLTVIHL